MATIEVSMSNFEELVEKNNILILDFWAAWCGPCKAFAPVFEKMSEMYPDIAFGKVNTDVEQQLAGGFNIRSIPTLMIFKENVIVFEQPGMLPVEALQNIVEQVVALDMNKVRTDMAAQGGEKPE